MNSGQQNQAGFTLIELMIVVAIVGILASVAISSYQTYTIRSQVTEGLSLAGNAKTPIVDSFLESGEAPSNREEAGMTPEPTDTFGKYVQSVAVVDGRVDVTFGNDAHAIINNSVLTLTPYETDDGSVIWRCGLANQPVGIGTMGTSGGGTAATYSSGSIDMDYMPVSCR